MYFRIDRTQSRIPNSILVYRPQEYSFDVEPSPEGSFTSVLLDDLNLEVDEAGKVISVWGLCPHTRWSPANLCAPEAVSGELFVVPDGPLMPGISVRLTRGSYLPVQVDKATGWVCIGSRESSAAAVTVFPGVIFELSEQGQITALWLKPHRGLQ